MLLRMFVPETHLRYLAYASRLYLVIKVYLIWLLTSVPRLQPYRTEIARSGYAGSASMQQVWISTVHPVAKFHFNTGEK